MSLERFVKTFKMKYAIQFKGMNVKLYQLIKKCENVDPNLGDKDFSNITVSMVATNFQLLLTTNAFESFQLFSKILCWQDPYFLLRNELDFHVGHVVTSHEIYA